MKTLSLKDRKSLLNKYPVSESQLQYEFKRSKKKGVSIKEWLDRKYFPVHPSTVLYHYTFAANLRSILNWGIIFGDAVTSEDHLSGINAPCLTSRKKYHNVTNLDEEGLKNVGYLRISCRFDHDDNKLISAVDFYNKHNVKSGVADDKFNIDRKWGSVKEHYFYKGVVDVSKIVAIHKYDFKTQKWIILEEEQALKDIKKSRLEQKTFKYSLSRMMGNTFNDTTGMVEKYYKENDKNETLLPLYRYTDYFVKNASKHQLKMWKIRLMSLEIQDNFGQDDHTDDILKLAITFYNKVAPSSKKIKSLEQWTKAIKDFADESNQIYKRVSKTNDDHILIKYPHFENLEQDEETLH